MQVKALRLSVSGVGARQGTSINGQGLTSEHYEGLRSF